MRSLKASLPIGTALLALVLAGCPAAQNTGGTSGTTGDNTQTTEGGTTPTTPTEGGGTTPVQNPTTPLSISSSGDVTTPVGGQVTLSGSATGGTAPLAFFWQQISGTLLPLTNANTATATVTASTTGTAGFRLTVTDATGATATLNVTVTITATALPPGVLAVNANATGQNNGKTWFDAFTNLQDAIAAARVPNSGITEIWVAAGTYTPAGPGGDRNLSFTLLDRVALFGGFAGTEGHVSERDLSKHFTILSGDLNNNDKNGFANRADNSEHVVTGDGLSSSAILDGFTISGGNALSSSGAGLVITNSSMIIRNCAFADNFAALDAAGMRLVSSNGIVLDNCVFRDNLSQGTGGGLSMSASDAGLTNCTFLRNSGIDGAGAWIATGSPTLTNCTFNSNAGHAAGGIRSTADLLSLNLCTFNNNTAGTGDGGGIASTTSLTAINCTFTGNSGGNGGGMNASGSSVNLFGCLFDRNSAASGGAAYLGGTLPNLINCTVAENTATGNGGGLVMNTATWFLGNCILWDNLDVSGAVEASQIFTAVGPDALNQAQNNDIEGLAVFGGRGNIDADPLFRNPTGATGDLRLQAGSPCIDAGFNGFVPAVLTTDLDGRPRIQGSPPTVDMGAYEQPA